MLVGGTLLAPLWLDFDTPEVLVHTLAFVFVILSLCPIVLLLIFRGCICRIRYIKC